MKIDCDVIRDLLPLYADEACSEKSRELVSAHLQDCPSCREMLQKLKETEIEEDLQVEKNSVIQYGVKRFKRRSAAVGSGIAGAFMIPILVCLIINLTTGAGLSWFFIVLAALGVEEYELPDTVEPKTPIGVKLVIEKWADHDGREFAALNLVYQTTAQLRNIEMLSLENPPMVFPIRLKGLTPNADGLYPLLDLQQRFTTAITAYNYLPRD